MSQSQSELNLWRLFYLATWRVSMLPVFPPNPLPSFTQHGSHRHFTARNQGKNSQRCFGRRNSCFSVSLSFCVRLNDWLKTIINNYYKDTDWQINDDTIDLCCQLLFISCEHK
ncbi:hypothetical protein CEXT_420001 [Caerostris extrusa]|uniref:Uncharacterized protein n=1 Tax=Caerostris extrusa TaxID=172846 RepID=A0AAV4XFR9_CAEEX|nr:hypothetical protein CEXT_420001 [Caerostris extrusa]